MDGCVQRFLKIFEGKGKYLTELVGQFYRYPMQILVLNQYLSVVFYNLPVSHLINLCSIHFQNGYKNSKKRPENL